MLKYLALITIAVAQAHASEVMVIEWTGGSFGFTDDLTRTTLKNANKLIPKNAIATRAQIFQDDIYVALPRYKPGVPVTLGRICVKDNPGDAFVTPFPDLDTQNDDSSEGLQSVVDIFVDGYGLLWALDTGVVNTIDSPLRKSPPKVVVFNLNTGKKVKTIDLAGLVVKASRLQYLTVDYGSDARPFLYITDAATRSILVFDVAGGQGYRLVLPKAIVGGRRDVLYAALVQKGCGNNELILTYLSGSRIFAINTKYIRSGSAEGNIQDLGTKNGKILILGTDGGAALFYRYEGTSDVYRWDANLPVFGGGDLVYRSECCYLSTQVLPDVKRGMMRVLESNFPDFLHGTVGCGVSQRISLMVSDVK